MKESEKMQVEKELDEFLIRKHYRLVNTVLFYQDGELLLEKYYNKFTKESRNNIKSIWKSILAICVGICIDKGWIKSIEEPVFHYLKEFDGSRDPYHKMLKIKHLLTMTSGIYWNGGIHYHCPMWEQCIRSKDFVEYISNIAMKDIPGTVFVYKEWDITLLSAVIGKAAGRNSYEVCKEYLYEPLKIVSNAWYTGFDGVCYTIPSVSFQGMNAVEEEAKSDLSARDIAKLGFLFLDFGIYQGKRIVSKEWVQQVLTPCSCNKEYGMLWWLGENFYGCRGFGGQEMTVLPEKRIVFVVQATATPSSKSYGDLFPFVYNSIMRNLNAKG